MTTHTHSKRDDDGGRRRWYKQVTIHYWWSSSSLSLSSIKRMRRKRTMQKSTIININININGRIFYFSIISLVIGFNLSHHQQHGVLFVSNTKMIIINSSKVGLWKKRFNSLCLWNGKNGQFVLVFLRYSDGWWVTNWTKFEWSNR